MPNTINNDTIFEMNNTADVDEPAMNSVDNHLMPPPAPLPVNNRGDHQGSMPPPTHLPMSLGSVEGGPVISTARLEDTITVAIGSSYSASTRSCVFPQAVSIAGSTQPGGVTMSSSVVSSLTDGPPSVIQGQGGGQKKTLVVGQRFLPDKESGITNEFAKDSFLKFANHFDKSIPCTGNPSEDQLGKYIKVLLAIHANIRNLLRDEILNFLQSESRKHDLMDENNKPCKDVINIQFLALKMKDKESTETYLQRALIFLKIPQKHNLEWVNQVKIRVKEQYAIRWPHSGEINFVESIARALFYDDWNQRMRRGMWNEANMVWYDRLPAKITKQKAYENTRVKVSRREFVIIGEHFMKGHLVEKVYDDAVVVKLTKVSPVRLSKEDYMRKAERLWMEKGVCELE
jgi:hypothetical protein